MPHDPLIAITHYHLRRGGVTRVIQNMVAALRDQPFELVVVSGEPPPEGESFDVPVVVVPGLGYDPDGASGEAPQELGERIQAAVRRAMGRVPDIWHIHNHHLGKNAAWTACVQTWSKAGQALCLHIHDFPEDGRPANYRYLQDRLASSAGPAPLYPAGARTHYVVLNGRDERILHTAGAATTHLQLLPNAVWTETVPAGSATAEAADWVLYPTRAIRRKNVGEFLLWSMLDKSGRPYGVTLAPENPVERKGYDRWCTRAAHWDLPVTFELGARKSFAQCLEQAALLATTSVAEGFGLAFLEPWLANRPVVGRDLPEITAEFKAAGLDMSACYRACAVPQDWIAGDALRARLVARLTASRATYGLPTTNNDVEAAWSALWVDTDRVDFGRLDEEEQVRILQTLHSSTAAQQAVQPTALDAGNGVGRERVAANQKVVRSHYGLQAYGRQLATLYTHIGITNAIPTAIDPAAVITAFLDPHRFQLLRT